MSTESLNAFLESLTGPGPLSLERFAGRLGAALKPADQNPDWRFYTFELEAGPVASGELRLNTAGDRALLSLAPREKVSKGAAGLDQAALGPRLGVRPNFRIPPEGIETEYYRLNGIDLAVQWTLNSHQLRSLVLTWEPEKVEAADSKSG